VRFVDFDVLGHVNNSVYWAMVEEQRARRGLPDGSTTVTLEHHGGIDPGASVVTTAIDTSTGFDLWVTSTTGAASVVAAVVRATVSPTSGG
jgi:acyl-ACP thioesterase